MSMGNVEGMWIIQLTMALVPMVIITYIFAQKGGKSQSNKLIRTADQTFTCKITNICFPILCSSLCGAQKLTKCSKRLSDESKM